MRRDVADWFIRKFTREGDIVLDPFMGAGTTAVSCISLNRHYIGIEISDYYCRMADERIKNTLTGGEQLSII